MTDKTGGRMPLSAFFPIRDAAKDVALLSERLSSSPRYFPIEGDYMEPEFKRGDFVAVAPCSAYVGAGIHVLDFGMGPALFWTDSIGRAEIRIRHGNPRYSVQTLTVEQVNAAVVGKVFASIAILDYKALERQSGDGRAAR